MRLVAANVGRSLFSLAYLAPAVPRNPCTVETLRFCGTPVKYTVVACGV